LIGRRGRVWEADASGERPQDHRPARESGLPLLLHPVTVEVVELGTARNSNPEEAEPESAWVGAAQGREVENAGRRQFFRPEDLSYSVRSGANGVEDGAAGVIGHDRFDWSPDAVEETLER